MGGDQGKNAGNAIQQAGTNAYNESKMTDQESQQYSGSFDIGNFLSQYLGSQVGMNASPSGALSATQQYEQNNPLGTALYDQTLSDVQNPMANYQSTLQPQLQQAQDTINKYYQSRGLLNSGISIGSMGTAGVDLAIQEAQQQMNYRQQALQNASGLNTQIYNQQQQNIGNLGQLYNNQQQLGQGAMNRQAQAAFQNANYQAYPAQAALGNYYANQGAAGSDIGGVIGGVGGAILGGPMGAAAGYQLGSGVGSSLQKF